MAHAKPRISSGSLFKKLETLPLPCQYAFSIMKFIIKKQEYFKAHSSVHTTTQRISTIFPELPTFYTFGQLHAMLAIKFLSLLFSQILGMTWHNFKKH